mmetsp:Transcript_99021/g.295806  ORF Transcript_99021/g.295806 Transcript_99021/m.295806 type:complete len:113 (+) Transcript_99021:80-418(+)
MAARNPGPFIHMCPVGFPSYCRHMNRDWKARKAFEKAEVNGRVVKSIYDNMGIRGSNPINKYTGRNRIRMRSITDGFAHGNYRYTKMNKHGFMQVWREGWLIKYGLDPDRFH